MSRPLCALLVLSLALISMPAWGQNASAQSVPANSDKAAEPMKPAEASKSPSTLDKIKLPPGGVIVLVEEAKEALSLLPKMILMSPDEYQKLLDRLAFLEKQLKSEKKAAQVCKLVGRLEGDFVLMRAEFAFSTDQPRTSILLGMQGAFLTDEGKLDEAVPLLDVNEEGFSVRVDKAGTHQLVLNLKAPLSLKRPVSGGGGGERGFELGLPGSAVTLLTLKLPAGVKELRWNDTLEKLQTAAGWEVAVGKVKSLKVNWREPLSLPGNAPLLAADSQIAVKLDDNHVLLSAEITLEDLRGQTKEWRMLLPPHAKVEVKAPAGLEFELLYPDGKRPEHTIRLSEASSERLLVNVQIRQSRPFPTARLPIGPFTVLGTYRQEGTITVFAAAEVLHGQRLLFHKKGDIYPRDVPKGPAGADIAAVFKFWNGSGQGDVTAKSTIGMPLELELKSEKIRAEADADHLLDVKAVDQGWLIEVTSTLHVKTRGDFLELQLPRLPAPRMPLLGFAASTAPFPAALSWLPISASAVQETSQAVPLHFSCEDDGFKLAAPDGSRRARLSWNGTLGTDIKLVGKYFVAAEVERFNIELPRPLDVADRGGKVRIKVNDRLELMIGGEKAALDRHEATLSFDAVPENISIAWKPYHPEFTVTGLSDIRLHEGSAEVSQQLSFIVPREGGGGNAPNSGQLRFRVPAAIRELKVTAGGQLLFHDPAREVAWISPNAEFLSRADLQLRYDFVLPPKEDQDRKVREFQVPFIWPEGLTKVEAKVRVYGEPGIRPYLADRSDGVWNNFGIEVAPGADVLPALVVQGTGSTLPLSLRMLDTLPTRLASMVCERGLIQVAIDEEGRHSYRARYLVQRFIARHVDIELPLPVATCLVNVTLDNQKINSWEALEAMPNIAQVPVQPRLYSKPVVLEIEYKLPASLTQNNSFWRTTLYSPRFRGEISVAPVRWQVALPYSRVAQIPGGNSDYRWGFQGWLWGPEPSANSADLELWLTGRESKEPPSPISLVFASTGEEPVHILHVAKQMWLLICSGLLLAVGLAPTVLSLSRTAGWMLMGILGTGLLTIGLLWPGWIPVLVFGCEPGAIVLLVLLGLQWMLQESYRRRLVFMPGFARLKSNSSLIRSGSGGVRREATTIDAPIPVTHSIADINRGSDQSK